MDEGKRK